MHHFDHVHTAHQSSYAPPHLFRLHFSPFQAQSSRQEDGDALHDAHLAQRARAHPARALAAASDVATRRKRHGARAGHADRAGEAVLPLGRCRLGLGLGLALRLGLGLGLRLGSGLGLGLGLAVVVGASARLSRRAAMRIRLARVVACAQPRWRWVGASERWRCARARGARRAGCEG